MKDRASSPEPSPRRKVNPGSYEDEISPCGFSFPSGAPGTVGTTITGLDEPQTFTNVAACYTPVARFNTENASFILPGTLAGILQDNFSIIQCALTIASEFKDWIDSLRKEASIIPTSTFEFLAVYTYPEVQDPL